MNGPDADVVVVVDFDVTVVDNYSFVVVFIFFVCIRFAKKKMHIFMN